MTAHLARLGLLELPLNSKIETIQAACCAVFGVPMDVFKLSRGPEYASSARMASMSICRTKLKATFAAIGRAHGGRDHGTAIHATKRIPEMLETQKDFKRRYEIAIKLIEELSEEKI